LFRRSNNRKRQNEDFENWMKWKSGNKRDKHTYRVIQKEVYTFKNLFYKNYFR
jgi:hypothetical protein